jgi:hypothetical protein
MRSLKVSGGNIYAGTHGDGVWVSPTSSPNWQPTSGMGSSADYIQTMLFNGSQVFAGNLSGTPVLYRSIDNGLNWVQSSTPVFEDKPVYAIVNYGNTLFAGTDANGVLKSTDNGLTWSTYNDGFKDGSGNWYCITLSVRSLLISNDMIFAGTDCGIWKRPLDLLPVTWLSFEATQDKNDVHLEWQTASESNTSKFVIEKKDNSTAFRAIGEKAAAGNSSSVLTYNFSDPDAGKNSHGSALQYRIKQIDNDGRFSYSVTRVVRFNPKSASSMFIYPNPSADMVTLQVSADIIGSVYSIKDIAGADVMKGRLYNSRTSIDISRLAAGVYFLQAGKQLTETIKLIKQ